MIQDKTANCKSILKITPELKETLNETRFALKGAERRKFMAKIVKLFGSGGQRKAERELGWDRKTIVKGTHELTGGIDCTDNFSGRGRKPIEEHLPDLLDDIKAIVEPESQADPTFRTTRLYSPITAEEVRRRLIESGNYSERELPVTRTICNKLTQLNYGGMHFTPGHTICCGCAKMAHRPVQQYMVVSLFVLTCRVRYSDKALDQQEATAEPDDKTVCHETLNFAY